jgi:hypothetical protein
MWVPIVIGAAVILMSLMTDYEAGAVKMIPLNIHLWIDGIAGVVLIFSPWIFGFREMVLWPHVILGIIEVGTVLMTETRHRYTT